jgi:hypothetical protein
VVEAWGLRRHSVDAAFVVEGEGRKGCQESLKAEVAQALSLKLQPPRPEVKRSSCSIAILVQTPHSKWTNRVEND